MNDDPLKKALTLTLIGLKIPDVDDGKGPLSNNHLEWMRSHCIWFLDTMPVDKVSRWVGFIQGCLASKGVMDVDEERDRTRPLFHEAYTAMGLEAPETMEPLKTPGEK